MYSKIY